MNWFCFEVSNEKGGIAGAFQSDCSAICPHHCVGTWKTWLTGANTWVSDSTLTVQGKGNLGSFYRIPPV